MTLASDLRGHIRGIIIANEVGNYLVEVLGDKTINSSLISAFVSGLHQLGKENLGVLNDMVIRGQSLSLVVILKYGLSLISIFDPHVNCSDVEVEASQLLDQFFDRYKDALQKWDGNQGLFEEYVRAIKERIQTYYKRTLESKEVLFSKLSELSSNNGK